MVLASPPATPRCFDSTAAWQQYLLGLHYSGEAITRRQDLHKHAAKRGEGVRTVTTVFLEVDYCRDCTAAYQRRMEAAGRCRWALQRDALALQQPAQPWDKGEHHLEP